MTEKDILILKYTGYSVDELKSVIYEKETRLLRLEKENEELKAKLKEGEVFIENIVKASADNPNEFFELRKENEELNRDKIELVNSVTELKSKVTELEKENAELKEQIEKMKCCQTCKYKFKDTCFLSLSKGVECINKDKWEPVK